MAEPTVVQRRGLAKLGLAMPDGSYYIRNGSVGASDLDNAIKAVGRGEPQSSHNAIRVHIMKRAKALSLSDKIPADWQADGSLKHGDKMDQQADAFLEHFGILGMRWGHHLPGVEVLGGSGNGDSKPAPFIQRGDHTGDKSGDSGPFGQDNSPHEQQAQHALDALKALHDHVTQATEVARAEAENADHAPEQTPSHQQPQQTQQPAKLTKKAATAVHAASKNHKAHVAQIHNKAKAAHAAHKANMAKLAKHPHKAQAKKAAAAANKLHAAHMNHLAKVAHQAHAAHQAHVAKLKNVSPHHAGTSQLSTHDKAALAKLSPVQRSALKKLTPAQRSTLAKMTPAQRAKLSHLTQAEKTALSHLSPAQKSALAKATAASAKKRHEAAVPRKTSNVSQNGSVRQSMDDEIGTFLEHHGIKGMKWGVRRNGGHPGTVSAHVPTGSSQDHQVAALIKAKAKANGGVHALSNEELRTAAERLNLEANYHRLNPQTGGLEKGRSFVKTVTSDAKTILDAVDTGRRVVKLAQGTQPSGTGHQSKRTRNKPLKVVNVRAA